MENPTYSITREKHLDHLVRVAPLIVLGYGIQSYVLMNMATSLGSTTYLVLGILLILMISAFVIYDTRHQVTLYEDHVHIRFFTYNKSISYEEILSLHTTDPQETFGTLMIHTKHEKIRLYFVDDIAKIKEWIEYRKHSLQHAA